MALLSVWVGEDMALASDAALAFYGDAGFSANVAIGQFQGRTFVSDVYGLSQVFEADNCKLYPSGSWSGVAGVSGVILGQTGNGISLQSVPNYLATLNFRFEHDSPVSTQNAKLYVHNGTEQTVAPSGLRAFCAEIIHPDPSQEGVQGTGDEVWQEVGGSGSVLSLVDSPGASGVYAGVLLHTDTRHDWYVAMSCCPVLPNDRTFGFTVEVEFI